MIRYQPPVICAFLTGLLLGAPAAGSDLDEFKVKRQQVFRFTQGPKVIREGDRITITFASEGYCDATVAVERADGSIARHLASGVLGKNAPAPFQRGSLAQTLTWDGKDDQGTYVDDKDTLTVRVSLGLRPRFERSFLWTPRRRLGYYTPIMRATQEGVYVYQAEGVDQLSLYDHAGDYLRTLHPFPANKVKDVRGLNWVDFPQGRRLPFKYGGYQQTLLTAGGTLRQHGLAGRAAVGMAVHGNRIALANFTLNRLSTDGATPDGLDLSGPKTHQMFQARGTNADHKHWPVGPTSLAFSPDGKTLYLAGYIWRHTWSFDAHHGIVSLPYDGSGEMKLFAGTMVQDKAGSADGQFNGATSVAVDRKGRVYASDFMNDRIQVFSPDGKHLKSIPVFKPAQIEIHPRTQELWVFTWPVYTRNLAKSKKRISIQPMLTRLGPFEKPVKVMSWPLPLPGYKGRHNPWWNLPPLGYRGCLDGWTDPPTIWIASGNQGGRRLPLSAWNEFNIRLLRPQGDKLGVVREFGRDVKRSAGRAKYPIWNIQYQMLFVNPKTGHLYFGEPDSSPTNKAYNQLVRIDPATGKTTLVDLPFNAEHLCFDLNGLAYLRSTAVVVRYNPENWREVPWDYGEQIDKLSSGMGGRGTSVIAGLRMPSTSPVCFHQGGMAISPKGHLAVSCALRRRAKPRDRVDYALEHGVKYAPRIFPGRVLSSTSACVHVWDKHGKQLYTDAVPGMPQIDGIGIDRDDNLYVMATPTRVIDGTRYFNKTTETLVKVQARRGDPPEPTFVSSSSRAVVKLPKNAWPKRPPDVSNYTVSNAWVNKAEWFYGGVGFAAFNGPGCACWRCHFALDHFARSFAPEMDQYSVAVLDANGNLILRVGQYGNPNDGVPLIRQGGPPRPRPIGGDEVGLFHAGYVNTHTDRRLFISDLGNARLLSVKLGYHRTVRIPLREVPDGTSSRK